MQWQHESRLFRTPADGKPAHILPVSHDGRVASAPLDEGTVRAEDVLLGVFEDALWYARPVDEVRDDAITFRDSPTELIATASALVRWHSKAPRCEACNGETTPAEAGHRRACLDCGEVLFFRTDPAVIVAITDPQDRLLLARQRSWPEGRHSVIAGFVEVGESLEQACVRETKEEVGLDVEDIRYFGSQPWPFPRSVMIGFTALAKHPEQLLVDGEEIVEASFLTRGELASKLAAGQMSLPGHASIGRALIGAWQG